jgi:hypothetical protein
MNPVGPSPFGFFRNLKLQCGQRTLSAMNRYVYPQEMKTPMHTKKSRLANGETETRMGKRPLTTAAVTNTNINANKPMKSQLTPTPTAATDTVSLLGLVDDKGLMTQEPHLPSDLSASFFAAR